MKQPFDKDDKEKDKTYTETTIMSLRTIFQPAT